jgi:hypothetical protein
MGVLADRHDIAFLGTWQWHLTLVVHATLHLSRLVVHHLDPVRYLSGKLYKLLVCWVLVHIIVTILGILEFDNEAVGGVSLHFVSDLEVLQRERCSRTAWPSGLLFFPPEKDLMYGFWEVGWMHWSFRLSMRLHIWIG